MSSTKESLKEKKKKHARFLGLEDREKSPQEKLSAAVTTEKRRKNTKLKSASRAKAPAPVTKRNLGGKGCSPLEGGGGEEKGDQHDTEKGKTCKRGTKRSPATVLRGSGQANLGRRGRISGRREKREDGPRRGPPLR